MVEGLDEHAFDETFLAENPQDPLLKILRLPRMILRILDLQVQSDPVVPASPDERDDLGEGRDPLPPVGRRELAPGIPALHLFQREVDHPPFPIGRALQRVVVNHNHGSIPRDLEVHLHSIHAQGDGLAESR
jgi:hypothetical protein